MQVVVKIGTSSLTHDSGAINEGAITKVCGELAAARQAGHQVLLVTSAAISAGLPDLGYEGTRPKDTVTLQAAAAVGQSRLLRSYDAALAEHGLVGGQILVSPNNFFERRPYLHARATLQRLLDLGVIPIINENDAIADEEIRFGDNDRIAALVAHAVNADALILLTDTAGVYTADPRMDENASLVEEIIEVDAELEKAAGGAGTRRGSGGMASKLAAARMATWSGVRTVIAAANRENVVRDAIAGAPGVGTIVHPRSNRLTARKLWIAFAVAANGRIAVDAGARKALVERGSSLLPAGVTAVDGAFDIDSGVEIVDEDGNVFAKGLVRQSAKALRENAGLHSGDLRSGSAVEVVHRDDLVLLV